MKVAAIVGVLTVRLHIADAQTLKDKRQVLRSLLDRLSDRFNVSVAEVGLNDTHTRAEIAVACVSNDGTQVFRVLDSGLQLIAGEPRVVIEDHTVEIV
jgi:uncharacterized protein